MKQFVYSFNEGSGEMRSLLGTKGAALAEMMQSGLPVPFGFTVTTEACRRYFENGRVLPAEIAEEIFNKMAELEDVTGKVFGEKKNPLFVSVRTGASAPMPGLAETILNLGMNAETPEEAKEQLLEAICDSFDSWKSSKAFEYRKKGRFFWENDSDSEENGAAVSVQRMVFGNLNEDSAVGIVSTRECANGGNRLSGKFLTNAQGNELTQRTEEVQDISHMTEHFPKSYETLIKITGILEKHFKDVQTVQFTIEDSKLYILLTETAERTPAAALKMAVDMTNEEIITEKEAILRLQTEDLQELLRMRKGRCALDDDPELRAYFSKLMEWADEVRELKVRANADDAKQTQQALDFGAEGIGLCRTENMFFDGEKMLMVRRMLLSEDEEECRSINAQLKEMQKENFKGIYRIMGERPVTIRLLDLPINDILPMEEENPMLGNRGCRLELAMPKIAEAQTEAVIEAALEVRSEIGADIVPEILIPMVSTLEELRMVKTVVKAAAESCIKASGEKMEYLIGTMIETPRAALTADKIAQESDFFSFGTNDLTQMVYGLSREDMGMIIETYVEKGVLHENPFRTLDLDGVGRLVELAAVTGKRAYPRLKLGICGEQASDSRSIEFCHKIGMNYLSCAPIKVPTTKLAAAQAAVKAAENEEER